MNEHDRTCRLVRYVDLVTGRRFQQHEEHGQAQTEWISCCEYRRCGNGRHAVERLGSSVVPNPWYKDVHRGMPLMRADRRKPMTETDRSKAPAQAAEPESDYPCKHGGQCYCVPLCAPTQATIPLKPMSDLEVANAAVKQCQSAEAKLAAVRRVRTWSPCPAEPEEDDDGPLYQGFVTDPGGSWVKVEDLVAILNGDPSQGEGGGGK